MNDSSATRSRGFEGRYKLPTGWCWTSLRELLTEKLCNGISVKGTDTLPGTPALKLGAMGDNGFDYSDRRHIPIDSETAASLAVREGDFFVSRGNGSLHLVGRGTLAQCPPGEIVFPDTMIRVRLLDTDSLRKYVSILWQSGVVRRQVEARARTTAGIYKVSQQDIEEIQLPLAPPAEQRRIVAKVEEVFSYLNAAVAALERVRAKLKRYRSSVLKAATEGNLTAEWRSQHQQTEPASALLDRILQERRRQWEEAQRARFVEADKEPPKNWQEKYQDPTGPDVSTLPPLPEGWCWADVGQLISFLRNGLSTKPMAEPPGHRILRINAVRPGKVDLGEVRFLVGNQPEWSGYLVEDGDLLFTRYNGSLELLGAAGLVRGVTDPTLHPDKLIRVKTVLPSPLPEYVELAANVGVSRQHLQARARTTAGQTGISGSDIREMPIPLPPAEEQAEIVREVEDRLSVVDQLAPQVEANLKRASRLRQGILKRAFEGRLVPQDPTDAPAEKLLERIRAARNEADSTAPTRRSRRRSGGEA